MVDYVELWDKLARPLSLKFDSDCDKDWSRLTETEQEMAALWKMAADVYNGGFILFYCNWGYECYLHALRGIMRSGCTHALDLVMGVYSSVFDKFRSDDRVQIYWDIPKFLTEQDKKTLEDADIAFWESVGEHLCEAACKFYSSHV